MSRKSNKSVKSNNAALENVLARNEALETASQESDLNTFKTQSLEALADAEALRAEADAAEAEALRAADAAAEADAAASNDAYAEAAAEALAEVAADAAADAAAAEAAADAALEAAEAAEAAAATLAASLDAAAASAAAHAANEAASATSAKAQTEKVKWSDTVAKAQLAYASRKSFRENSNRAIIMSLLERENGCTLAECSSAIRNTSRKLQSLYTDLHDIATITQRKLKSFKAANDDVLRFKLAD